ncbi:MAG: ATPase, T2SS/T4P/T4SS family [Planctomycetota bacterium]
MVRASGKIRRLLIDGGLVSNEEWTRAASGSRPVLEDLVEREVVAESALLEVLGLAGNVAPIDVSKVHPDHRALEALPKDACEEHCALPIARTGDVLTIVVADPFDVLLLDDLHILAGCKVKPLLSHPAAIRRAIAAAYDTGAAQVDELLSGVSADALEMAPDADEVDNLDLAGTSDDPNEVPSVKLVNLVLLRALRDKASDIHVEPGDQHVRIRFRIDGRLVEIMTAPKQLLPSVISRLKILANLDIAERMGPQDGKFQIRYEGRSIDFRLSTLPVVGGEKAVLRILDSTGVAKSLDKLGYEERCLADMKKAVDSSYGMLLVTGPTGSGKSTTLYASVKEVASPEINVVTVEDPVEYRMDGINQVPVNPKRGLTFAGALRSILRQDPDVVLVGEIRDTETAEIAIKAALTGHLVLSTLHTNDAPGAVTRLVDMGIDPFMVSSSLLCVAAQRLARVLCQHCRQPVELPREELLRAGFTDEDFEQGFQLHGANQSGCPRCTGGYKGRFAILETLYLSGDVKRAIIEGASSARIKELAVAEGMLTLRRVGLLNAMRGRTSLEEVLRVTMGD